MTRAFHIIRVYDHPSLPNTRFVGTVKDVVRWIKANQRTAHRIAVSSFEPRPGLSGRMLVLAILNNDDWSGDETVIFDVRQPELGKMKSIDHELARVRGRRLDQTC